MLVIFFLFSYPFWQKEYQLAQPARDAAAAAAKAKLDAEALSTVEYPLHADNEWNIR